MRTRFLVMGLLSQVSLSVGEDCGTHNWPYTSQGPHPSGQLISWKYLKSRKTIASVLKCTDCFLLLIILQACSFTTMYMMFIIVLYESKGDLIDTKECV